MKTITQYKEDIKNLMEECGKFDTKAVAEGRDLTDAEIRVKNEMLDLIEETQETVKTLERQERLNRALSIPEGETRKAAKTVIEVGDDRRTKDRFNTFGEQIAAIVHAGMPGGRVDPRLHNTATGLNETTPSDGGFLVQSDFSKELIKNVWETGKIAPLCKRIQISGTANGTKINAVDEDSRAHGSRMGGIRGYWAAEAAEKTKSQPKFRQMELVLKKLIGLCYATDEMLNDAAQLEGIIRQGFVDEFAFLLDDAILNGTGAGQPMGVLNGGGLVSAQGVTGQGTSDVIGDNIIEMWGMLFSNSRTNAVWLVNQEVEVALMRAALPETAAAASPTLVYMPPGGLSASPYGSIFGRPVIPVEQCQAIGTLGDIILGDFSNGYLLAEKGGIDTDMSIHVRFVYDESVFRFVMRVDGQPVRNKRFSPYKGTANSLGHFVGLQSARHS